MNIFFILAAFILPYLLGSVNFSILISKMVSGKDIRESGSGNAGATNMLRTYGKKLAVITLILDVLKGVGAVLFGIGLSKIAQTLIVPVGAGTGIAVSEQTFGAIVSQMGIYKLLAGLGVIIGHNFPLYFGFKGGKGVATSLGTILTLNWQVGLIVLVFALVIMAVTRYVSLGSVMAAVIYVAVNLTHMIFTDSFSVSRLVFDLIVALLLIFRHRANIKRLLAGTENKLGQKKEG